MVGLDPRLNRLPSNFNLGPDPPIQQVAQAFENFCCEIIDVVAPLVPCVKPQAAFFENSGPPGMQALWNVVRYAQKNDLLVVMDAKRGDIGSTANAYAQAYLGDLTNSTWACDALTVNPYLGDDSLDPFVQRCRETGAGIFVLVRTSNPGGKMLQELTANDQSIYSHVGRHIQNLAHANLGESLYGDIGAVVGATHPQQLAELRQLMPNTLFLVPGFGAQGGTADDVVAAFDDRGLGAIVNSSRGIIFAYENEKYSAGTSSWQDSVRLATEEAIEQLPKPKFAGSV